MKPTRRQFFIESALAASALASLSGIPPAVFRRAALAAAGRRGDGETVLVAIQLTGGNDGLNTVVPFEHDAYARARRTLRLAAKDVHRIEPGLGFHPEMRALREAYGEGLVAVVQGVGYPSSSRDHDAALRDWHTAAPGDRACETGWLGRAVDEMRGLSDVLGAFVGGIPRPRALDARAAIVPALRDASDWTLPAGEAAPGRPARSSGPTPGGDDLLDFIRDSTEAARASAAKVAETLRAGDEGSRYPDLRLAADLRSIARLIRAEIGIRIFVAELGGGGIGGFDSHANQAENHGALLRQLSESLAAFLADLRRDRLLDRVLVFTYSEFGRTVRENGRRGTDHGAAAPVLAAGGKVRGGVLGPHPEVEEIEGGGLRPQVDFRRLYATVLGAWLGLDPRGILGQAWEPLDLVRSR